MMGNSKRSKPDDMMGAWKDIFHYIGKYKFAFILTLLLSALSSILALLGPYFISEMTDLIQKGLSVEMDIERIRNIGFILIAIYLISGIFTFFENYMMATVSQRCAQMFRMDISRKMNRIPLRYFDQSSKGDVMSRVTNDVDTLGASMNQCIGSLVTSITTLLISFILMAILNIPLTLLSVCIAVVGFILIKVIAKRTQRYFRSQQKNLGSMNSLVEEQYTGHTVVSIYAGQRKAMERFDTINEELGNSAFRSQFLGGISSHLNGLISNVGYVLVCVTGAILYMHGETTIGTIVAFMIYVKLFTGAFSQISNAVVNMQSVAAAAERVFIFLNYEEMPIEERRIEITDVKGRVEFRDVHFGYSKEREIIHGFSAIAEPGQKISIVGATGSGKTTMINLLMRFYEVDSGDILIDGTSTKNMTREQVRDLFGMVLQETWMFEGTVRENIVFNREGVDDDELDRVCESVGLKHFISSLPEGYDTMISDVDSMSVGQRQQIAIARAMIGDPRMIILDEATSSVDPLTEKLIKDATNAMMKGKTSFVIAHRLSTIIDADKIIVMDDGRIVETGRHEELLNKNGIYKELFDSQFDVAD
ncbi:MAG: ABC transporter ATP-binding protein [Methanomassiliicoccales archaeon]|uniref:ABC transporter ATP-binding protein n=1 Tax=Candidatus Methanarcanum hacksteinii TaxID=2911857 RepID=UPI002A888E8E|nr:ABC transporter ATP-binding protein/permease [Methanomassiliicoccales archaeon]MDD7479031.1 ABC transporter ATP-binding protein [Methanomassiliicoccales archaeon]MDY4581207.1 ABC transporter ATP-binding protein [Candidatus Methanarcanum hacksteinii]